jgi:hypothetical protein
MRVMTVGFSGVGYSVISASQVGDLPVEPLLPWHGEQRLLSRPRRQRGPTSYISRRSRPASGGQAPHPAEGGGGSPILEKRAGGLPCGFPRHVENFFLKRTTAQGRGAADGNELRQAACRRLEALQDKKPRGLGAWTRQQRLLRRL